MSVLSDNNNNNDNNDNDNDNDELSSTTTSPELNKLMKEKKEIKKLIKIFLHDFKEKYHREPTTEEKKLHADELYHSYNTIDSKINEEKKRINLHKEKNGIN